MDDERDDGDRALSNRVEAILAETACLDRDDHKYPMRREELAVEYADHAMDLPNETEALGSVFDRLGDRRYATPADAREAVVNELTGAEAGFSEGDEERVFAALAADSRAEEAVDEPFEER